MKVSAAIIGFLFLGSAVSAEIATIDGFSEGFYGEKELIDGGIRFFNPDDRSGHGQAGTFAIEDVASAFPGFPDFGSFSSPNVLTMSVLGPGPNNWAGSRFGEIWFSTGAVESFARVDVFHADDLLSIGNAIELAVYLNGDLVGSDSVPITTARHQFDQLSVTGVDFDSAVIRGLGDIQNGVFFGAIDNVVIAPDPSTMFILGLGVIYLSRRKSGIRHGACR